MGEPTKVTAEIPQPDTREKAVSAPVVAPEAAPPHAVAALAELKGEVPYEDPMDMFNRLVKAGKHDFVGDDSGEKEVEENVEFQRIRDGLAAFLKTGETEKPEFYKPWAKVAVDFMVAEIASYHGMTGSTMGPTEVAHALEVLKTPSLTGNCNKPGVGSFETWITKSKLAEKYATWKSGEASKKIIEDAKKQLPDGVAEFKGIKARLEALPTSKKLEEDTKTLFTVAIGIKAAYEGASALEKTLSVLPCPKDVMDKVVNLKERIAASPGDQIATLKEEVTELKQQIPSIEKLDTLLKKSNLAELRDKLIAEVKAGTKTVDQATKELEEARKAADTGGDDDPETDDPPMADKLLGWIKKMPGGAKMKGFAGALVSLVSILAVGLSKWSWTRGFASNLMSYKLMAQKGVAGAAEIYKTEKTLRTFGLPRAAADALAQGTTKDAIMELTKAAGRTTDKAEQAKLTDLSEQLKSKGGTNSEVVLAEFMDPAKNPAIGTGIEYKEPAAAVATAPVAPPAAPATQPTAATTPPATAAATPQPPTSAKVG